MLAVETASMINYTEADAGGYMEAVLQVGNWYL
jgi:hypothetical protein